MRIRTRFKERKGSNRRSMPFFAASCLYLDDIAAFYSDDGGLPDAKILNSTTDYKLHPLAWPAELPGE